MGRQALYPTTAIIKTITGKQRKIVIRCLLFLYSVGIVGIFLPMISVTIYFFGVSWTLVSYLIVLLFSYHSYKYVCFNAPTVDLALGSKISVKDLKLQIKHIKNKIIENNLSTTSTTGLIKRTGYPHPDHFEFFLITVFGTLLSPVAIFFPLSLLLIIVAILTKRKLYDDAIIKNQIAKLFRERYDEILINKFLAKSDAKYNVTKKREFNFPFKVFSTEDTWIDQSIEFTFAQDNHRIQRKSDIKFYTGGKHELLMCFLKITQKSNTTHTVTIINNKMKNVFDNKLKAKYARKIDFGKYNFSKEFSVYCDDEIDVRKVLRARNILNLLESSKRYKIAGIQVDNEKILVILNSMDVFKWLLVNNYNKNFDKHFNESNAEKLKRVKKDMQALDNMTQDILKTLR